MVCQPMMAALIECSHPLWLKLNVLVLAVWTVGFGSGVLGLWSEEAWVNCSRAPHTSCRLTRWLIAEQETYWIIVSWWSWRIMGMLWSVCSVMAFELDAFILKKARVGRHHRVGKSFDWGVTVLDQCVHQFILIPMKMVFYKTTGGIWGFWKQSWVSVEKYSEKRTIMGTFGYFADWSKVSKRTKCFEIHVNEKKRRSYARQKLILLAKNTFLLSRSHRLRVPILGQTGT